MRGGVLGEAWQTQERVSLCIDKHHRWIGPGALSQHSAVVHCLRQTSDLIQAWHPACSTLLWANELNAGCRVGSVTRPAGHCVQQMSSKCDNWQIYRLVQTYIHKHTMTKAVLLVHGHDTLHTPHPTQYIIILESVFHGQHCFDTIVCYSSDLHFPLHWSRMP